MMWFDVVGNSLAFIGSVVFSADLLKSKEQVQDENATYVHETPAHEGPRCFTRRKEDSEHFFALSPRAL